VSKRSQETGPQEKTPLTNVSTETLDQESCWRRMLDSHYQSVARLNTGVGVCQITFYAIFLRHLVRSLTGTTVSLYDLPRLVS